MIRNALLSLFGLFFIGNVFLFAQNNNFIGNGLTGYYYQDYFIDSTGVINCDSLTLAFSRIDTVIDYWNGSKYFRWQPISGWGDYYSVEWKGFIYIQESGEYGFGTISDDGSQIFIDSILIVDNSEIQWYDWEDNINEGDTSGTSFPPLVLDSGFHEISIRFYENTYYDGIELWWFKSGADSSDIPYYGTNFHEIPPTYNDSTNWELVPKKVLFTNIDSLTSTDNLINKDQNPNGFYLNQNYPNPFNPKTNITYTLSKAVNVKIDVFNLLGQKIKTILNRQMPIGLHEIEFTAQDLPSGVYLYRIEAGEFHAVRKMILLR
jgi:hypothetical protein